MQSILAQSEQTPTELRRCLTAFDLILLGIGGIIGAGIFVITGIAAATQAGPAIVLSYVLAGLACGFCALSYAELASSIGGCGSAYGYVYSAIGQLAAWVVGWDLLLEYGMDAATVSIGWSGYMNNTLQAFGITLPSLLINSPFHGGIINFPAVLVIFCMATLLSIGTKQSATFNNLIVAIKLLVIALFIALGLFHFNPDNWHPYLPFGAQGIVKGASFIFFAYIGFDTIATASDEAKDPKRDLPIGIIGSLLVCTVVYIMVAGTLTGITYYTGLNTSSPVSGALLQHGHRYAAEIVALGVIAGLTTTILAMFYGFTRVFLAMARDGFLPTFITKIHAKSATPRLLIWTVASIMMLTAGFVPISDIANLVNIGTLAAFIAVCGSVVILRYKEPHLPRPFKMPGGILFPLLGALLCIYLVLSLPMITWVCFLIWTGAGLLIYFCYSRKRIKK